MNNTVEKYLFWISQGKVATVHRWGGQMSNVQAIDDKFSQVLPHKDIIKIVYFWQSYLKNKKVDDFLVHSVGKNK